MRPVNSRSSPCLLGSGAKLLFIHNEVLPVEVSHTDEILNSQAFTIGSALTLKGTDIVEDVLPVRPQGLRSATRKRKRND
jgi:hypothetical protein